MSTFSLLQMKAAKSIVNLYETGDLVGKYDTLVILADGAGITYGKTQTTENGGGLWRLLFEVYTSLKGVFVGEFEPYRDLLFKKGEDSRKSALTQDQDFKDLLVKAAREDVLMRRAQDEHFHKNYYRPALQIAEEYSITLPLIMAAIYDFCIHSGPEGASTRINAFNEKWDPSTEETDEIMLEKDWGKAMVEYRDNWLRNFNHNNAARQASVRNTVYRTESLLDLMEQGSWDLALPFQVKMVRKTYTITEGILAEVW